MPALPLFARVLGVPALPLFAGVRGVPALPLFAGVLGVLWLLEACTNLNFLLLKIPE